MEPGSKVVLPRWIRVIRLTWAAVLVGLLLFSVLMAAWGDLREALMLRVISDRHVKSFLLQFPQDARVWAGDELLGAAEPHPLSEDEPEGSEVATEGLPILLPRVYVREDQVRAIGVRWDESKPVAATLDALAPGATLLWHDTNAPRGFMPVLLGLDGRIDYALLLVVDLPGEPRALLLRAEHDDKRVFRLARQEVESDQLAAGPGGFWAERRRFDGMPPRISGQTKTIWRWYFEFESDQDAWAQARVPVEWSEAAWRELTQ